MAQKSSSFLEKLKNFDTSTLCDALEKLELRLRNEGYTNSQISCQNNLSKPMVGHAVTFHVRTGNPPMKGNFYQDIEEWWKQFLSDSKPYVAVFQDVDSPPGQGAVMGAHHGTILKFLGCVGVVTNGAVRDVPFFSELSMHIYSQGLTPSHGYMHITDMGKPVEIGGLKIHMGDLLHGDQNGLVLVPEENPEDILASCQEVMQHKRELVEFLNSKTLDLGNLKTMLKLLG